MSRRSKPSRNAPCSCGSNLKFKRCCGAAVGSTNQRALAEPDKAVLDRMRAMEIQRVAQQGLGKPIISGRDALGNLRVTVGNDEFTAGKTEVFIDFAVEYFGKTLTSEWTTSELRKPFGDRHVILQWFDLFNRQRKAAPRYNDTFLFATTGASVAFVGLAYCVYLMRHNAELQSLLIARLKDRTQFQGAYFELAVANVLIRAGFELALEDETDKSGKHCEFVAKSKETGKSYSVECKTRSVAGQLHKTDKHASKRQNPLSQLKSHMNLALQKPSRGERIIFIDVNMPGARDNPPPWVEVAGQILEEYERTSRSEKSAYVFVTNLCYHWHLEESSPPVTGMAHGFNIPDFGKVGNIRFSDAWRRRRKHRDAHRIFDSLHQYANIPLTFDGSLPSVTVLGEQPPVQIGGKYFFPNDDGGISGTVLHATVLETERRAAIVVSVDGGGTVLIHEPMSEWQVQDYRSHRETYFGRVENNRQTDDEFEFFERLVEIHMPYGRDKLSNQLKSWIAKEQIDVMTHEDLVLATCEAVIFSLRREREARTHSEAGGHG